MIRCSVFSWWETGPPIYADEVRAAAPTQRSRKSGSEHGIVSRGVTLRETSSDIFFHRWLMFGGIGSVFPGGTRGSAFAFAEANGYGGTRGRDEKDEGAAVGRFARHTSLGTKGGRFLLWR